MQRSPLLARRDVLGQPSEPGKGCWVEEVGDTSQSWQHGCDLGLTHCSTSSVLWDHCAFSCRRWNPAVQGFRDLVLSLTLLGNLARRFQLGCQESQEGPLTYLQEVFHLMLLLLFSSS